MEQNLDRQLDQLRAGLRCSYIVSSAFQKFFVGRC
ncbi:hypothetical protein RIU96_02765 [Corynebacterium sp. Z-1]|nr:MULTISPECIES: hypothetical protein [Corynebacterium]MCT1556515.1 hypothetical protein [Corynebacterium sanguinis]WNI13975.1 hypothetical protein RIU96_02765 [Corynebacterium sp. Z-1]